jgi:hypothetical protein
MNILLLLLCVGAGSVAQEGDRKTQTFSGNLRHHKDLEGGVWTLKVEGTVYDLHGDLKGFADGDEVEIRGTVEKDKVCIHQVGTVFRLESVRKRRPGE